MRAARVVLERGAASNVLLLLLPAPLPASDHDVGIIKDEDDERAFVHVEEVVAEQLLAQCDHCVRALRHFYR